MFRALFACHFAQGFFDKTMNWTPTYFSDRFPEMRLIVSVLKRMATLIIEVMLNQFFSISLS